MGNVANNKVDPNRAQSEAQLGKHITDIRIYHISKYMYATYTERLYKNCDVLDSSRVVCLRIMFN